MWSGNRLNGSKVIPWESLLEAPWYLVPTSIWAHKCSPAGESHSGDRRKLIDGGPEVLRSPAKTQEVTPDTLQHGVNTVLFNVASFYYLYLFIIS